MRSILKNYLIKTVYILIDVVFIYWSFYTACLVRQHIIPFDVHFTTFLFDSANPFRTVFMLWFITVILYLQANGLYRTKREVFEGIEVWFVFKSVFLASLVTIVISYMLKVNGFPRTIFGIAATSMFVYLSIWRALKRMFVSHIVSLGYNNFNVLIIGAGKVGSALHEEISKSPQLGLKIIGFLDDYKSEAVQNDFKILGKISDFSRVAKREFIDKVFITVHDNTEAFVNVLEQAREMGVAVHVIPQGFDLALGKFSRYNIGLIPILEYTEKTPPLKQAGKRIFDLFCSSIGILFLSPVFIAIAILIKHDSPGPVFYVSKRYGRSGRIFNMYKFRSMKIHADKEQHNLKEQNEVDGPIFKMKNDPRITELGKVLRKFSLDELPQLFNVFKGEMSLVGPRPLPIEQIHKEDLLQLKRLEVRPGITGLWQIRGRSDISFTRLVRWDVWYINNWSFWLDVNILLQTFPVVFKAKGAY